MRLAEMLEALRIAGGEEAGPRDAELVGGYDGGFPSNVDNVLAASAVTHASRHCQHMGAWRAARIAQERRLHDYVWFVNTTAIYYKVPQQRMYGLFEGELAE